VKLLFAPALPLAALAAFLLPYPGVPARHVPALHLVEYVADSTAFDVTSTLVVGPTEVLLVDAQLHVSDARQVADLIAGTGKHLTAIVITHPDEDHYFGASTIVARFPGTPVYMTAAAIPQFERTWARFLQGARAQEPAEAPDTIVTPHPLPSLHLTVDGVAVEVIPDLQGDVLAPLNSILWIPSLRTVLAGDVLFSGVHPYLAQSTAATRDAWRQSLDRIRALHPTAVVPGHKRSRDLPDAVAALDAMTAYLTDFDAARQASPDAPGLVAAMQAKYPDFAVGVLLRFSARRAYAP
jgi:glyoxylase-like metal-dependent hydrolase (beta-lactamase superfamily II)